MHIQLKADSGQNQNLSYKSELKFNNSRYNLPLSNGKQIAFCLILFATFHYITVCLHKNMIMAPTTILFYRKFLVEPILLKISLPILYITYRQDVCQFMWREICDYTKNYVELLMLMCNPPTPVIDIRSNI